MWSNSENQHFRTYEREVSVLSQASSFTLLITQTSLAKSIPYLIIHIHVATFLCEVEATQAKVRLYTFSSRLRRPNENVVILLSTLFHPVHRAAKIGVRVNQSGWPNLHTYKAHSMCFRGRKSTQLRESLNPSLPQHPGNACTTELMDVVWMDITHARIHIQALCLLLVVSCSFDQLASLYAPLCCHVSLNRYNVSIERSFEFCSYLIRISIIWKSNDLISRLLRFFLFPFNKLNESLILAIVILQQVQNIEILYNTY